ncbi:TPA: hypothetical protein ACX6QU_000256 [Photobacterium damselae]
MNSTNEIFVSGLGWKNSTSGICNFQTVLKVSKLLSYLPEEHALFDTISASFERSINKKRIMQLTDYLVKSIENNSPIDSLRITFFVNGPVKERKSDGIFKEITFNQKEIILLEGFLAISAICQILSINNPFTGKKNVYTNKPLSIDKKAILNMDLDLKILYPLEYKASEDTILKLFVDMNTIDQRVYSQNLISTQEEESALILGANILAKSLGLEHLGGVSNLNKITKSDSFITTRNTLIYIILASLGGRNFRIEKEIPSQLPDKTKITLALIDKVLPEIIEFMKGWICGLEKELQYNHSGFHHSMQVWQALGLVIYHLRNKKNTNLKDFNSAGKLLSKLDYSKSAEHWSQCQAFKKDSTNTFWINATGGGRTFRDKVAQYFIELIEEERIK